MNICTELSNDPDVFENLDEKKMINKDISDANGEKPKPPLTDEQEEHICSL